VGLLEEGITRIERFVLFHGTILAVVNRVT
jgi:hypothetical protein